MLARILCATDGSEHADRALRYATQLASQPGAELHIVHVIEKLTVGRLAGQNVFLNEAEIKSKITQQTAEITDGQGVNTTLHATKGNANRLAQRIAEIADNVDADVIVIGTHGHAPIAGLLLGSVTAQLLHVAHRPVLALPPTGNPQQTDAQPERLGSAAWTNPQPKIYAAQPTTTPNNSQW